MFPLADDNPDGLARSTMPRSPWIATDFVCRPDYKPLATGGSSRDRYSSIERTFAEAKDECVSDRGLSTGFTHLVVLDDLDEVEQLKVSNADHR